MTARGRLPLLLLALWLAACATPRSDPTQITVPPGALCRMEPSGGMVCAPPAPSTYTLTITTTGAGQADATSVQPVGPQPAGTPRTLTVTPAVGSAFGSWSAGCANMMPQPAADTTCTATLTTTGPPPSGLGTWTRLSYGTGRPNWYYDVGAICTQSGLMWFPWNGITSRVTPPAVTWTTDTTVTSMGWRENFAAACTDDNIVHLTPGTSGPPEWSGYVTYDLATRTYATLPVGGCNAHAVLGYDRSRQRLLSWGGWSTNCPLRTRPAQGTAGWTELSPSGPQPPLTQEGARETSRRGGVVSTTGDAWVLADGRELYWYTATSNAWRLVPTTGPKPGPYAIAALHEGARTIVAVGGCPGLNDSDCGAGSVRETHLLDLSTMTWRLGPTGSAAVEAMAMSKRHATFDVKGQRVIVFTASPEPVNGQLGTAIWAWVPDASGPPPTVTYPLSLATSGSGSGMLTGAGPYPAGQSVTISAAANATSEFKSWSGAPPCPNTPAATATFTMPAGALTCTASFASSGPPPTATCTPRTREWVECPTPATGNPFPADAAGSKDIQVAWDGQTLVFGAGDIRSSGVADLYRFTLPDGTWTPYSVGCRPAGEVMLNHPSDRGPIAYDKRGQLWMWNGVPYPNQEGQACGGSGAIQKAGLLVRAPSGVWTQASSQATGSLGNGAYDATDDVLLHFEHGAPCSGNPGSLIVTKLSDLSQSSSALCLGVTWTGSTGGWVAPQQPERVAFGWDPEARKAYVLTPQIRYDAPGNVVETRAALSVWDHASKTWSAKKPAPVPAGAALVPFHMVVVWDSVNKRLLYPRVDNPCGEVRDLHAYNPATDTWESFAVPTQVHGSTAGFDPRANALVLGGSVFCTGYAQRAVYLWRYADAPAGRQRR